MDPLISVIIANYNNSKYISRCLQSLKLQTYENFEVIIVDDGSTDSSVEEIQKFLKNDSRFNLLLQTNKGVSSARNYGLNSATGIYVFFLDSDDWVETNMFEQLVDNNIEKFSSILFDSQMIGNKFQGELVSTSNLIESGTMSRENTLLEVLSLYGIRGYMWNKIFLKSIIDKFNIRFDENISMAEDLLFCIEFYLKSERENYYINSIFHNYFQHPKSALHSYNVNKFFDVKWLSDLEAKQKIVKLTSEEPISVKKAAKNNYLYSIINMEYLDKKLNNTEERYIEGRVKENINDIFSFILSKDVHVRTKINLIRKVIKCLL